MSAPNADGWIDWAGGECPVPGGTQIKIQFDDESRERAENTATVRADRWLGAERLRTPTIKAYRVVQS